VFTFQASCEIFNQHQKDPSRPRIYVDGHEYSATSLILSSDDVYISSRFLRDVTNMELFWDSHEEIVVYTNPDKVFYMGLNDLQGKDILWKDHIAYIPLYTVKLLFQGIMEWYSESLTLYVERPFFRSLPFVLPRNISVHQYPEKYSEVITELPKNQQVTILRILDTWVKIKTNQNDIGWIFIQNLSEDLADYTFYPSPPFAGEQADIQQEKICMTWQYVYRTTPNPNELYVVEELNVISPTWLSLHNPQGELSDKGRKDYIEWAHSNQYQVWIACTNSFDPSLTREVLKSTKRRKKVIESLLQIVLDYEAEGVNIDWENIYLNDKDLFTQFLRELYPIFNQEGLVVSVDITAISESENWSMCYDRRAIGKVSDYVVLMAYDQYWAGGDESGSVAEYEWVKRGIEELINLVPSHKVIVGIPFYSRLWIEDETIQPTTFSSESYFMDYSMELGEKHAAQWDETMKQYYAQWRDQSHLYKLWIEDPRSIKHKVQLVHDYGLAGAAFWRKGYEIPEVWPLIGSILSDRTGDLP
jgi:spore germination protein YaaH